MISAAILSFPPVWMGEQRRGWRLLCDIVGLGVIL